MISQLKTKDLGELYQLMFKASEKILRDIIKVGILLGHSDLIYRGYEVLTERALIKKGASEDEIEKLEIAYCQGNIDQINEICKKYGIDPFKPTEEELKEALKNAVQYRGFSIDDGTSVGKLYQALYGKDFLEMEIEINGNGERIPYTKIPYELKDFVNRAILKHKGIIKE